LFKQVIGGRHLILELNLKKAITIKISRKQWRRREEVSKRNRPRKAELYEKERWFRNCDVY